MTRNQIRRERVPAGAAFDLTPGTDAARAHEALTPIVFKGTGGYIITGPESHHVYCFSSHDPEQMVDARDTDALLKTGLFRISS